MPSLNRHAVRRTLAVVRRWFLWQAFTAVALGSLTISVVVGMASARRVSQASVWYWVGSPTLWTKRSLGHRAEYGTYFDSRGVTLYACRYDFIKQPPEWWADPTPWHPELYRTGFGHLTRPQAKFIIPALWLLNGWHYPILPSGWLPHGIALEMLSMTDPGMAGGMSQVALCLPVWLTVSIFAVPPIVWTVLYYFRHRRRRRARFGLCKACGYDLRGSPARCPECGRVPHRSSRPAMVAG